MEPSRWALDPFLKQPIKTFENTQEAIPSQALYGSNAGQMRLPWKAMETGRKGAGSNFPLERGSEGQTTPYGFDSGAQGLAETVSPGPNR
jgi:hypothetical protein